MPMTKKTMGGEGPASPPPKKKEAKPVANVKVRVLYPSAFAGIAEVYKVTRDKQGRITAEEAIPEVMVDSKVADGLIAAGHAEKV